MPFSSSIMPTPHRFSRRFAAAVLACGLVAGAPATAATMLVTGQTETNLSFQVDALATGALAFLSFGGEASGTDSDTDVMRVNKFNPSLGTLTNINVSVSNFATISVGKFGGCAAIAVLCGFATSFDAEVGVGLDMPGVPNPTFGAPIQALPVIAPGPFRSIETEEFGDVGLVLSFPTNSNTYTFSVGESKQVNLDPAIYDQYIDDGGITIVNPVTLKKTFFPDLLAIDTIFGMRLGVDLYCSGILAECVGGGTVTGTAQHTVIVTYEYSPHDTDPGGGDTGVNVVPLPTALPMLAMGLGLLGVVRRRGSGAQT
jgi:hypothetical protein